MEESKYKSIDISGLNFGKPISVNEALKDVTPMNWGKDVLSGEKTVTVKCDREKPE